MRNILNLIKKAKNGDGEAYLSLFQNYEADIYRMAFLYINNKEDTLDVVQEKAYQSFKSLPTLREPKYFKTWLIRIAINCALDLLRKRSKIVSIDTIQKELPLKQKEGKDWVLSIVLEDLIYSLKNDEKTVILLRFYHDFTIKEVAEFLNIPLGTANTLLYRALKNYGFPWKRVIYMNHDIKREFGKIPLPEELHERSIAGINKALNKFNQRKRNEKRFSKPKFAIVAAILVMTSFGIAFRMEIAAAVHKFIQFIPGLGAVEMEQPMALYILKEPVIFQKDAGELKLVAFSSDKNETIIKLAGINIVDIPQEIILENGKGEQFKPDSYGSFYSEAEWGATYWYEGDLNIDGKVTVEIMDGLKKRFSFS